MQKGTKPEGIIYQKVLLRIVMSSSMERIFMTGQYRALARKEKKFCILYELGNKTKLGVWGHCKPLSEFSGEQGQSLWQIYV